MFRIEMLVDRSMDNVRLDRPSVPQSVGPNNAADPDGINTNSSVNLYLRDTFCDVAIVFNLPDRPGNVSRTLHNTNNGNFPIDANILCATILGPCSV